MSSSSLPRRDARTGPNPDSVDLYFQGLAWLNKGETPDQWRKREAFLIARSPPIPDNVDALMGSACADQLEGALSFATDPMAAFEPAEAKVAKRALSEQPEGRVRGTVRAIFRTVFGCGSFRP
jgi:hypothetical protein